MAKLFLTKSAKANIKSIAYYTEERFGIEKRNSYLKEIFYFFDLLLQSPLLGKPRDELFAGMRSIAIAEHVAYYYCSTEAVKIVALLHKSMEPNLHLGNVH